MSIVEHIHQVLLIRRRVALRSLFQFNGFRLQSPSALGADLAQRTLPVDRIPVGKIAIRISPQVLLFAVVAYLVTTFLYDSFENLKLIPLLILTGSFAVPMACLVFFWEVNVPRNVNFFVVLFVLISSGILGIAGAHVLFRVESEVIGASKFLNAAIAGPVEETAKLAAVILLAGLTQKYPWVLNGLLLGAASGVGFAAFESAGYAFEVFLGTVFATGTASMEYAENLILFRGVLSPFCHVVWTAASAGALWKVMAGRPFRWAFLMEGAFVRVFASSVVLHMMWNSPLGGGVFELMKFAALGYFGWIVVLGLVQEGCGQIHDVQRGMGFASAASLDRQPAHAAFPSYEPAAATVLESTRWRLRWSSPEAGSGEMLLDRRLFSSRGGCLVIGRSPSSSDLSIADASVSRRHAVVRLEGGRLLLSDCDSSNGTKLNGRALQRAPHEVPFQSGDRVTVGDVEIELTRDR